MVFVVESGFGVGWWALHALKVAVIKDSVFQEEVSTPVV